MQLKALLKFRPRDLLIPLQNPVCWPDSRLAHIGAHLVGGALVWMVGLLLGYRLFHVWDPWLAVLGVGLFQTHWEFLQQETDANYPLWSMIWDAVSAVAAASIAALVFGLVVR